MQDEKTQKIGNHIYKYSTSWIHTLESKEHWQFYWQQQKIMQGLVKPTHHVLEIGVGTGFSANYLRSKGVKVTTLDIDEGKKPDIVANAVNYEFKNKYDHILAFEVFEHIPFDEFEKLLSKLATICQGYIFMSIPNNKKLFFELVLRLPKLGKRGFSITKKRKAIAKHHFWEVNHGDITQVTLENIFNQTGLYIHHQDKLSYIFFYTLKVSNV